MAITAVHFEGGDQIDHAVDGDHRTDLAVDGSRVDAELTDIPGARLTNNLATRWGPSTGRRAARLVAPPSEMQTTSGARGAQRRHRCRRRRRRTIRASTMVRSEPGSRSAEGGLNPPTGPAGDLAAGRLRLAHSVGDVGEGNREHVGQEEDRPLHRFELVEHGQESESQRVGQHGGIVRARPRRPGVQASHGSDVGLATSAGWIGCGRGRSGWSPWSARPRAGLDLSWSTAASGARHPGPRPRRRRPCPTSGRPSRRAGAAPARRGRSAPCRSAGAHATLTGRTWRCGSRPPERQAGGQAAGQGGIGQQAGRAHPVAGHGDSRAPRCRSMPGRPASPPFGGPGEGAGYRQVGQEPAGHHVCRVGPRLRCTNCSSWGRSCHRAAGAVADGRHHRLALGGLAGGRGLHGDVERIIEREDVPGLGWSARPRDRGRPRSPVVRGRPTPGRPAVAAGRPPGPRWPRPHRLAVITPSRASDLQAGHPSRSTPVTSVPERMSQGRPAPRPAGPIHRGGRAPRRRAASLQLGDGGIGTELVDIGRVGAQPDQRTEHRVGVGAEAERVQPVGHRWCRAAAGCHPGDPGEEGGQLDLAPRAEHAGPEEGPGPVGSRCWVPPDRAR